MCGIVGCVGISTDKKSSHTLITHLLQETQIRGPHATGHFAVNNNGEIFSFKSPVPSKIYTQLDEWKMLEDLEIKAIICHARYKTHGSEYFNTNNHPHVSKSGNIGLIHNGTINRFNEIKSKFKIVCDSDSELLLRTITSEKNIITGIKKIYKYFGSSGDFACEVIHRNPINKMTRLFFFRDPGRPGRFIDARKELGQMFFCSTTPIWSNAIKNAEKEFPDIKQYHLNDLKVQIVPSFKIIEINAQNMAIRMYDIENKSREKIKTKKLENKMTAYERWEMKQKKS